MNLRPQLTPRRLHMRLPTHTQHGEYIPEEIITSDLAIGKDGFQRAPRDVPVAASSAVLFDANLLHSVHPNLSQPASERIAFHYIPGQLDSGFRGTSFARRKFADRHLAIESYLGRRVACRVECT